MKNFRQRFEDGATGQPSTCPLEYISVTKSGDELRVDAKARNSGAAEVPRTFKGPTRFLDYDRFWRFMEANMSNFNQCANPMATDADYLIAKQQNDKYPNQNGKDIISGQTDQTGKDIISGQTDQTGKDILSGQTYKGDDVVIDQPIGCPFKKTVVKRQGDVITLINDAADPMMMTNDKYKQFWNHPLNQLCTDPLTQLTPQEPQKPQGGDILQPEQDTGLDIDKILDTDGYNQPQLPDVNWPSWNNDVDMEVSWTGRLFRLIILFGLVFIFTTIIPQNTLDTITKLLISTTVVVFYALLDVFKSLLRSMKGYACEKVCGCSY